MVNVSFDVMILVPFPSVKIVNNTISYIYYATINIADLTMWSLISLTSRCGVCYIADITMWCMLYCWHHDVVYVISLTTRCGVCYIA